MQLCVFLIKITHKMNISLLTNLIFRVIIYDDMLFVAFSDGGEMKIFHLEDF